MKAKEIYQGIFFLLIGYHKIKYSFLLALMWLVILPLILQSNYFKESRFYLSTQALQSSLLSPELKFRGECRHYQLTGKEWVRTLSIPLKRALVSGSTLTTLDSNGRFHYYIYPNWYDDEPLRPVLKETPGMIMPGEPMLYDWYSFLIYQANMQYTEYFALKS